MNLQDPALTFALALAAGVLAQSVARHLRVPGIILLLATGVALGPALAHVIRPEVLGSGLQPIVGLAVAVILFDGGLQLNLPRLRREAVAIRRLITIGALFTLTAGTVAAELILGWEWRIALLFGALVVVTGPTVINPLTRRIRLRQNLRTILEAEGVLVDPIGAVLAVVALRVVLAPTTSGAAAGLLGLPYTLGLGLLIGVAGGLLIGGLLRLRNVIPGGNENIFTLAAVLALYQASHAILPESGIMTVAIAGLVVGNMPSHAGRQLAEFKEQLTTLLVGLLFVLLSAAVELDRVVSLGWPGLVTVLALILVVRPLAVGIATFDTRLSFRERAFLAWLAPRGIIAFAISSLFAEELAHVGMAAEGEELRAMVFLVIAVTVVVQGGTGGLVSRLLGVRMPSNDGFVIVGANPVARLLARALEQAVTRKTPVVLIDSNAHEAGIAEKEGFRVVYGNARDAATLMKADVRSRRALMTATPNEGVNLLLANRVREESRELTRIVAVHATDPGVVDEQVHETGAHILFGVGLDFDRWAHELRQGRIVTRAWRAGADPARRPADLAAAGGDASPVLPLAYRRGDVGLPVHDGVELRAGDIVWLAYEGSDRQGVETGLSAAGWNAEGPG